MSKNMPLYSESEGEHTKKVRIAVHSEMRTVKRIQFWATLGLTILAAGFGAAMYLNRYAQASDVSKISDKQDVLLERLHEHIEIEATAMATVQATAKNTEEDYHQLTAQMQEVVKAVGARPTPKSRHRLTIGE